MGVSRGFQGCLKHFYGKFLSVSRMLQDCFKGFEMEVSKLLQECFNLSFRKFQGFLKF